MITHMHLLKVMRVSLGASGQPSVYLLILRDAKLNWFWSFGPVLRSFCTLKTGTCSIMSGIQGFRTVAHISIVPAGAEQTEQEMCTDVLSPKMKIKTYFYLPTVKDIWVLHQRLA